MSPASHQYWLQRETAIQARISTIPRNEIGQRLDFSGQNGQRIYLVRNRTAGRRGLSDMMTDVIRRFCNFIRDVFAAQRPPTSRRNLLGMYFGESNSGGRRRPNRDRA